MPLDLFLSILTRKIDACNQFSFSFGVCKFYLIPRAWGNNQTTIFTNSFLPLYFLALQLQWEKWVKKKREKQKLDDTDLV